MTDIGDDKLDVECERIREKIRQDWDWPVVVSGYEGTGKSTMAFVLCKKVDPEFTIDSVVFDHKALCQRLATYPKYRAILLDEAGQSLFSREAITAVNREIVKALMMVRARNLFFVMCIPNFRWLDSYVREHRTRTRVEVYTLGGARGWADFYRPIRDRFKPTTFWKPLYTYRFQQIDSDEWREYEKRKLEVVEKALIGEEAKNNGFEITDHIRARVLRENAIWSYKKIGETLGKAPNTIRKWILDASTKKASEHVPP